MTIALIILVGYVYGLESWELLVLNLLNIISIWMYSILRKGEIHVEVFKAVSYVLFIFIPAIEYSLGIDRFYYLNIDNDTRIFVFVYLLLFNTGCLIFGLKSGRNQYKIEVSVKGAKYVKSGPLITVSVFCVAMTLYLFDLNIEAILLRGGGRGELEFTVTGLWFSIFSNVIRPMPLLIACYVFHYNIRISRAAKLTILLLGLLCLSPFSAARYLTGAVYLTLIYVFLQSRGLTVKITAFKVVLILLGPFLLFDLARVFSYDGFDGVDYFDLVNVGHFDAFGNALASIYSVEKSWGYGLLGAVLFFVPRVFWESKPVGTGYAMMDSLGQSFKNISMPYFIEGYHNFSLLGLLVFSFLFVKLYARLKRSCDVVDGVKKEQIPYVILSFHVAFLLRGDLINSVSYGVALLIACYCCKTLLAKFSVGFRHERIL